MDDLFAEAEPAAGDPVQANAPLAARMRPESLEEFVGQDHILGPGKLLRRAIESDRLTSIILYGPPGVGKTSLAQLVAKTTSKPHCLGDEVAVFVETDECRHTPGLEFVAIAR